MIDIHCHLLPGIDDGAANIEQSLALLRHAVADGITHMVFTPHIQPGTYDNNRASIAAAYERLNHEIQLHEIPMQTAMAAEVRICPEILPMIAAGDIPMFQALDGKQTLLLEFPHSHIPPGSDKMVAWLHQQGIGVLIAHPERNKEMMANSDKLMPFLEMGCALQLTAGSVVGLFGATSKQVSVELLQQGSVMLLATDAHHLSRRPPELEQGRDAAATIIGLAAANAMVGERPWAMVGGMFATA